MPLCSFLQSKDPKTFSSHLSCLHFTSGFLSPSRAACLPPSSMPAYTSLSIPQKHHSFASYLNWKIS